MGAVAHRVVASGVPPDVEGGILPPVKVSESRETSGLGARWSGGTVNPAGREARLYGRQDACRHDFTADAGPPNRYSGSAK
jgi:hypothetical protein